MSAVDAMVPPHSDASEAFVVGSMMIDKDACALALEKLVPEDFFGGNFGAVFEICRDLYATGKATDITVVASELKRLNKLADMGGAHFLMEMIEVISTTMHVGQHIDVVKNYSILRELSRRCSEIARDCFQHEDEPRALLEKAEKYIYAISERGTTSQMYPLSAFAHEAIEGIEKVFKKQAKVTGVETGFPRLDKLTSGLQPGNMVVLAARPGMGKTAMALEMARHVAVDKGLPVALYSLEMTKTELFLRLLSLQTGMPHYGIRTGYFGASAWLDINTATERMAEAPIFIDDSVATSTALGIRGSARRLAGKMVRDGKPLALIVVDYLQLINSTGRKYGNRQEEVADISRNLKGLARDLHVPVLALSQLNRSPEELGRGGRPRLSDLRESGAIEQDSDLVMFIYREAQYKSGATDEEKAKTKLIVAKHRNGAQGEIDFHFHKETMRFYETDKTEEESQ